MIVKNESSVITRCLASVRPLIDAWVIVDTGSTDGTQEIIKEYLKDIPGQLYERPWVNFEHNREEALQLAKQTNCARADYLLFIDADDYFVYSPDFQLPELTHDYYLIISNSNGTEYYIPRLIKSELNWHWHGVLHEYVQAKEAKTGLKLKGIQNVYTSQGARSKDPNKCKKDAQILEEALKKEPNNARYLFYLAQSAAQAGDLEKGIENYEKRVKMGGWQEEVYWSLLQIARLQERLHRDAAVVEQSYLKALNYRPSRQEPRYSLVKIHNRARQFEKSYEMAKIGLQTAPTTDCLFVEKWIDDYGLLFEFAIAAYWTGHYEECKEACDKLLAVKELPQHCREYILKNRPHVEEKVNLTSCNSDY